MIAKKIWLLGALSLATVSTVGFAQTRGGKPTDGSTIVSYAQLGEPVTAVSIDVDMRDLPVVPEWKEGARIKEMPRYAFPRPSAKDPSAPADWVTSPDLLDDAQELFDATTGQTQVRTDPSRVTIDNGFSGVFPGDPVGDVGTSHFIFGLNRSTGTSVTIYNKSGTVLSGPTALKSLAPAGDPCASSQSDPIVLFDRLANRWFLLEIGGTSSANRLCMYVSKTADPVSGGWWFYSLSTSGVPDYPHCGVWTNSYICTTNEGGTTVTAYAFDRANMLNGATARPIQKFTTAKLAGYGFQALTPITVIGNTAPPAGSNFILARHNDDEAHAGASADTTKDFVDLFSLNVNWTTPTSSTLSALPKINISEFNSWFVDYSTFATVPQPGTTSKLDPIREVIMNSLSYRNVGAYESIVGDFVTNQNAARSGSVVDAGVRWFELRRTGGGAWTLNQEGTFSPGDANTHHLIGSIATDKNGNIGLSYNVSKTSATTVQPSFKWTGRLVTDANGVMTQGENTIAAGTGVNTSGRWGDYAQLAVDPVDDCTFYATGSYQGSSNWATRVGTFAFTSCTAGGSTFSISGNVATSGAAAISGVTINYGSGSVTTDASGNYTISGLANGTYTLTPSLSGATFSPTSMSVTVSSANVTGQNFVGTLSATTFSISGNIATSASAAISGVTVSYGSGSATTDASGNYTISGLANGTYTLTPSKTGFTFSPTSLSATVSGANVTGRNFVGTATVTGGLANGVGVADTVNSTTTNSAFKEYQVNIAAGATNLVIKTTGATRDVDLYVRKTTAPTLTTYDCRPFSASGNETCTFATTTAGTYFVRVYGYATGASNFTVTATWTP
jgi:Bacterial pre-peptidase C-terminal domain